MTNDRTIHQWKCSKVHAESSKSLRHCKRVNACVSVSVCRCLRYSDGLFDALDVTWNFHRDCEWHLYRLCHLRMVHLPSLVRCLGHETPKRQSFAARWTTASKEILSPKRRNVKKDNWWVPAIEFQYLKVFRMFKAQKNVLIHLDPSTWLGVSMRICSFYKFIMLSFVICYMIITVILLAAICNHLRHTFNAIDFGRASLTQARPGPQRFELNQNEAFSCFLQWEPAAFASDLRKNLQHVLLRIYLPLAIFSINKINHSSGKKDFGGVKNQNKKFRATCHWALPLTMERLATGQLVFTKQR